MKCPTCKKDTKKEGNKVFPFCSARCHMIDLGKWLNEEYKIPDDDPTESGGNTVH